MLLVPDFETFRVNPWINPDGSKVARMICDEPFPGCPRMTLQAAGGAFRGEGGFL